MLLILISWIYSLFLVVNLGVGFAKWLKVKVTDLVLLSFFGLFSTTILAGFWAVFYRINFEFHLVFLFLNLILFLVFKKSIVGVYQELWTRIKSLALVFKIILSVIALLIIAQCASVPYLIDNETYYIQTIKWLNEYGFVKGLANLDLLFAQTSGWHIAQSALNFSFIYGRFNDLSGFCLLLANVYAILQLQDLYKSNQQNIGLLLMGMLPLFNVLLFQFISTPSPDLVVYVLSFVIFSYIISNYKSLNLDDFKLISILVFWGFIVKSTSIIYLFIPLFLFLTNYKTFYIGALKITFLGTLVFSLFIIKNTILLGYPLFPLRFTLFSSENYAVPNEIIQFYFSREGLYRFFVSSNELQSMNVLQIVWR